MSVLNKIAYFQNRRDEKPNKELARELAESMDNQGIQEIAENLQNKNKNIQSDCLKVLYEIGYINPELVAVYVEDFLMLLKSTNNRMVWGGMIGLSCIAEIRSHEIFKNIDDVITAVDQGTLITVVAGVKTLAKVASTEKRYRKKIFPVLIEQLKKCLPRDVPLHTESMLCTIDDNKEEFISVITSRQEEMNPSQLARLKKVLRKLEP
jgi:hypothetical protein